jgi:glyoxylase-like metal-dependent hydrolase (beta-lactamase superfamily II)
VQVERIAEGLWRWTARHPEWIPDEGWDPDVGCVYYEAPDATILFEPLVPGAPREAERFWRALDADVERRGAPVAVLLGVWWHERSAQIVHARYTPSPGAAVWAPADSVERLDARPTRTFAPGNPLPGGVEAFRTARGDEVCFWVPEHRALVVGDVLLGLDGQSLALCPAWWVKEPSTLDDVREALRLLLDLDLDVERVLVSHGPPVLSGGREALAAALA